MIRVATPLLLATLGEMFTERAGVLNLGIEGIMLLGAMVGFTTAYFSGELWLGIAAAAAAGVGFGLLMGALTVSLGLSQHVSGLADLPWLGPVLFDQFALVYLAFLLVPLAAFVLYHTPWGLSLRTAGENPHAAVAAGVNVAWVRYQALMISGALMGIAGAYLSLAQFNSFTFGVVSGRGWVCIALVVLGQWDPWRVAGAALLFGALDALGLRLQSSGGIDLPYQVFLMLPFVATIVAMAVLARKARAPAALLTPFRREER